MLVPARCANVTGQTPDPAEWRYQLDVGIPDGSLHATYPAAASSPLAPRPGAVDALARALPVLADAPALATLAHAVERSLLGEHATPVSRVMTCAFLGARINTRSSTTRNRYRLRIW